MVCTYSFVRFASVWCLGGGKGGVGGDRRKKKERERKKERKKNMTVEKTEMRLKLN